MAKRPEFTHDRFIIAEGFEDVAFLRALIDGRNLNRYDVSPTADMGAAGGTSGFENAFLACEPIPGFDAVHHVVIVADNDDNPTKAFRSLCRQLERARTDFNRTWGDPTNPGETAAGDPTVSVWMWPAPGVPGCLETLLWQVVQDKYPTEAECIETAILCTGINEWSPSKLAKARIRCFTALKCKRNPAVALGILWRDFRNVIPVTAAPFKQVADFLVAI